MDPAIEYEKVQTGRTTSDRGLVLQVLRQGFAILYSGLSIGTPSWIHIACASPRLGTAYPPRGLAPSGKEGIEIGFCRRYGCAETSVGARLLARRMEDTEPTRNFW